MAVRLARAGFDDFVLLEKGDGVGGTWYHNRYPGCACDIPSHLYSFSFEVKRDWSRPYASQPEIKEYLEHCVKKYDLESCLRLNTPIVSAQWDEGTCVWHLETAHGDAIEADVVIGAIGMF